MGRCCSRKAGKCYGELSSKGEGMRWALEHLVGEGGLGSVLGGTGYCGFLGRERSWRMTMTLRAETKSRCTTGLGHPYGSKAQLPLGGS